MKDPAAVTSMFADEKMALEAGVNEDERPPARAASDTNESGGEYGGRP